MPPGHFNAIFLNDSNPLEQKAYKDAFNEAKKQGAFIFWNHPGWARQQPDSTCGGLSIHNSTMTAACTALK